MTLLRNHLETSRKQLNTCDVTHVISSLPDLHLMMSVNSLLSPASEASDTVPTVAIFLLRSHGTSDTLK